MYSYLSNNFLDDKKFIDNTNIHKNLKIRRICLYVPYKCGSAGVGKKQCYTINCPNLFYKRGFCNIRCSFQHTIDSMELIRCDCFGKEQKISKIWNPNGVVFEQLRKIYKISDQSIVPLITEKIVPYLENSHYKIIINYNQSTDLKDIDDIILSYEMVELDEGKFVPFQYSLDMHRIIENNQDHADMKNIIHEFDYVAPRIEYTGSEVILNKKSIYRLNYYGYVQSILIYTPNNSVLNAICEITVDYYNKFVLPVEIHSNGEYTVMNFLPSSELPSSELPSDEIDLLKIKKYCINSSLNIIAMSLHLEVEKYGTCYTAEIFAICHKINRINRGNWIQI
jgi:hypothetical protein